MRKHDVVLLIVAAILAIATITVLSYAIPRLVG